MLVFLFVFCVPIVYWFVVTFLTLLCVSFRCVVSCCCVLLLCVWRGVVLLRVCYVCFFVVVCDGVYVFMLRLSLCRVCVFCCARSVFFLCL